MWGGYTLEGLAVAEYEVDAYYWGWKWLNV